MPPGGGSVKRPELAHLWASWQALLNQFYSVLSQ